MKKITPALLKKYGACSTQMRMFKKAFPKGLTTTPDNVARVALAFGRNCVEVSWLFNDVYGKDAEDDFFFILERCSQERSNAFYGVDHEWYEAAIAMFLALEEWEYER
jgi:hypothetical protein